MVNKCSKLIIIAMIILAITNSALAMEQMEWEYTKEEKNPSTTSEIKSFFLGEPKELTEEIILQRISGFDYPKTVNQLNILKNLNKEFKETIDNSKKINEKLGLLKYYTKTLEEFLDFKKPNGQQYTFDEWIAQFDTIILDLIKNGADVNAVSSRGNNALCTAIVYGNTRKGFPKLAELIIKLIDLGININYRDSDGDTPLIIAVLHLGAAWPTKSIPLIEILLKNGANPNIKDEKGETALDLAGNNLTLGNLLLEYHAKHGSEIRD